MFTSPTLVPSFESRREPLVFDLESQGTPCFLTSLLSDTTPPFRSRSTFPPPTMSFPPLSSLNGEARGTGNSLNDFYLFVRYRLWGSESPTYFTLQWHTATVRHVYLTSGSSKIPTSWRGVNPVRDTDPCRLGTFDFILKLTITTRKIGSIVVCLNGVLPFFFFFRFRFL